MALHFIHCSTKAGCNYFRALTDGNPLNEGKRRPFSVIIGTSVAGWSVLDANMAVGTETGTALFLLSTVRPNSCECRRTFHVRTSPESLPSSIVSVGGRFG